MCDVNKHDFLPPRGHVTYIKNDLLHAPGLSIPRFAFLAMYINALGATNTRDPMDRLNFLHPQRGSSGMTSSAPADAKAGGTESLDSRTLAFANKRTHQIVSELSARHVKNLQSAQETHEREVSRLKEKFQNDLRVAQREVDSNPYLAKETKTLKQVNEALRTELGAAQGKYERLASEVKQITARSKATTDERDQALSMLQNAHAVLAECIQSPGIGHDLATQLKESKQIVQAFLAAR